MKEDKIENALTNIVLFTVNQHETDSINLAFGQKEAARPIGQRSYWNLGTFGGVRVFHSITQMGDQSTSAAARAAIVQLSPKLIFCVGIAWGAKPSKWKIGDLLLATRLHDWANRKESTDDGVIPRGFSIPPRDDLLQLVRTAYVDWKNPHAGGDKPVLHDGLLLSNPVLLDDYDEREKALQVHPEAVGGEMEGRGLVWEANQAKVDWLIIKAICDWGAAKNVPGVNKEESQKLAAQASATFVRYLVETQLGPALSGHQSDGAKTVNSQPPLDISSTQASLDEVRSAFNNCRYDSNGPNRRRSLRQAVRQLHDMVDNSYAANELEARIWRELTHEARSIGELQTAWANTILAVEKLIQHPAITSKQETHAYDLLAEWSIDFSQSRIPNVSIDKSLHQLNKARKSISMRIGVDSVAPGFDSTQRATFLCMRSKCDRAAASLIKRQCQHDIKVKGKVNTHKNMALHDAEEAFSLVENELTQREYALCLLIRSTTSLAEDAIKAMNLLETAALEGAGPLTRYELARQYRFRFKYLDAIKAFEQISDPNHYRFLMNSHYFASSVIGLYYDNYDQSETQRYALKVLPWLEELISIDRHHARDVIDLCYLRAISGWEIDECTAPLRMLRPSSTSTWSDLANLAKTASQGDLAKGLLLGLEDAAIWSRIGSFYLEFANNPQEAIEFYERAILISPLSPVFHFNKAEAQAYGLEDFSAARVSLRYAKRLKQNAYAWFKAISPKRKRLESKIEEALKP